MYRKVLIAALGVIGSFSICEIGLGQPTTASAVTLNTGRFSAGACEVLVGVPTRVSASWQNYNQGGSAELICPVATNDLNLSSTKTTGVNVDVYDGSTVNGVTARICYQYNAAAGCGLTSTTSAAGTGNSLLAVADLTPWVGGLAYYNTYVDVTLPPAVGPGAGQQSIAKGYAMSVSF